MDSAAKKDVLEIMKILLLVTNSLALVGALGVRGQSVLLSVDLDQRLEADLVALELLEILDAWEILKNLWNVSKEHVHDFHHGQDGVGALQDVMVEFRNEVVFAITENWVTKDVLEVFLKLLIVTCR